MSLYENLLRPLLFRLDPEDAHQLAARAIPLAAMVPGLLERGPSCDPVLKTFLAGQALASPVGLAAGFDKNGHFTPYLADFGFSFAEIGSITASASLGNPRPRLFRLPADQAVINRMGLNGDGAAVVAARLSKARFSLPVAVNIAKTNDPKICGDAAIEDQVAAFAAVRELPLLYVAINASCPNTHAGCLAAKDELAVLLASLQKANTRALPMMLKLSPDSSDELLEEFVGLAIEHRLVGFVCGNTTVSRENLQTDAKTIAAIGNGGLSGRPLRDRALALVRRVYKLKSREQEIIGCGGIASGADALAFVRAGASALQIYTAMVYRGADVVGAIKSELSALLNDNRTTLQQAVGSEKSVSSR